MSYWEESYLRQSGEKLDEPDGWLEKYRPLFKDADVLDLGCGTGSNLPVLLSAGARITAADLSRTAADRVRETFGERIVQADCFDMREGFPYPDESFDAVVADLSLHYFSWTDTVRIIGEIRRILRIGGCLIARVHSIRNLDESHAEPIEPGYYLAYGHPRRYFALEEIRSLFSGWKLCKAEETQAFRFGFTKQVIELAAVRE